jgi:uncharacterized MnhB-related membrane protein
MGPVPGAEASGAQIAFDALVGAALVFLAWRSLASIDPFRAVVLFIVFGLLMALAWVRLEAPDIALAEAAIGAGVTGALMLDAVADLRRGGGPSSGRPANGR